MAKKEEGLTYLQMPLPKEYKKSKLTKKTWQGYNRRQVVDTGMLAVESNISTAETPYLIPSGGWKSVERSASAIPIGIFGFADFLIIIYAISSENGHYTIYVDYRKEGNPIYTGVINSEATFEECLQQRCVVPFNVYDVVTDPAQGEYIKQLLIFPDKKGMDFDIGDDTEFDEKGYFTLSDLGTTIEIKTYEDTDGDAPTSSSDDYDKNYYYQNTYDSKIYGWDEDENKWVQTLPPYFPDIKYATVHLSRLFGVDDVRVYASGFNDYTNWNLDTVDKYNEANAWCSASGANVKAGGEFTGITAFQGHVICFKKDFMHEIYNTKNPFRIQDIYAEGCVDNRTIQDVDGQLIFVSEDNVKVYTGSNPRIISYYLGIDKYSDAVSGTDGRNYYLYCKDEKGEGHIFVYDTYCSQWSRREAGEEISEVKGLAWCSGGMYMLCGLSGGGMMLAKLDSEVDKEWHFETDLITNESCDIKHIEKLQMFCDMAEGASMNVYFKYDGSDDLHEVWSCGTQSEDIQKVIRVKPRMTAHHGFKVCVEGSGFVRIRSMELLIQGGGDLYV